MNSLETTALSHVGGDPGDKAYLRDNRMSRLANIRLIIVISLLVLTIAR